MYSQWIQSAALLCLLLLLSACGGGSSKKSEVVLRVALPEIEQAIPFEVRWSASMSGDDETDIRLKPKRYGDIVYVAGYKGDVSAVNADDGKQLWSFDADGIITAGVGADEGLVLVAMEDSTVIALDSNTGKELWRNKVNGQVLAAPVVDSNIIVVRVNDDRVTGLSASDGSELWSFTRDVPPLTLRGVSDPLVGAGVVLVGYSSGRFIAAEITKGRVLWDTRVSSARGRNEIERLIDIDSTPVIKGSELYMAAYQGQIMAMGLNNRRIVWTKDISTFQDIAVDDSLLYVTEDSGALLALDRFTGEERWSEQRLRYRSPTNPVLLGKYVVVADVDGLLHVFTKEKGTAVARLELGGQFIKLPENDSEVMLLAQNQNGKLFAIKIE